MINKNVTQQRIFPIVVSCPADTTAHASKLFLFTIFNPKFPQLTNIQDRYQQLQKNVLLRTKG